MLERRAISSIPGHIPSIVVAASDAQEREYINRGCPSLLSDSG
jgi:hypothetical protein